MSLVPSDKGVRLNEGSPTVCLTVKRTVNGVLREDGQAESLHIVKS